WSSRRPSSTRLAAVAEKESRPRFSRRPDRTRFRLNSAGNAAVRRPKRIPTSFRHVVACQATGGSMRNVFWRLPLAVAACALMAGPAAAQGGAATTPAAELKVGDMAPDFTLQATDGKTYSLSKDLRGK